MCYNGNMTKEELTKEELVKVIADNFYISFLPSADKDFAAALQEIDVFTKYTNAKRIFDRESFINDAREKKTTIKLFEKFLPKELIFMGKIKFKRSLHGINSYYQNIQTMKLEGGFKRAVIEYMYDKRFRENFNKLKFQEPKLFLSKPVTKKCMDILWPYKESCFVLDYIKRNCYEDDWDFSSFTDRKGIGRKQKRTYEKFNQFTAYKLYAQGEYSKLRIGLKKQGIIDLKIRNDVRKNTNLNSSEYKDNQEKQDAYLKLKLLEKSGFEEIIEKINPKSYQRIKNFSPEYREGYDKFFVPEKDRVDRVDRWKNEHAQEKWEYDTEAINLLMDEVNKNLQIFNGSYIAYSLDDVLKTFCGYDEKETADVEKEFSKIYPFFYKLQNGKTSYSIIDKIDYIKNYKDENPGVVLSIDNNEWEEIKEKRNPKVDYRKLAKLKKIPDSYNFNTYELQIISKAYEDVRIYQPKEQKIRTISGRIDKIDDYLSKNPEYRVGDSKKPLKNSKTWENIKNKKKLSMSISLDTPVGETGKETLGNIIEDKNNSLFVMDIVNKYTMKRLKSLFKKEFPDDDVFIEVVNKILDKICDKICDDLSNSLDKKNKKLLGLFDKTFDQKHSWENLWTIYKNAMNISENEDDEIRNDFRQKMSKIRNNIKNSSQEQLVK